MDALIDCAEIRFGLPMLGKAPTEWFGRPLSSGARVLL
jgi:hypothetical protein